MACFKVCLIVLFTVLEGNSVGIKTRNSTETTFVDGEHTVVRRTFGNAGLPCNMTNGVYVERFDRIDYNRVEFLLTEPRYPSLPTLAICLPTFEQPVNWSDFYGSRLRTYFVPLEDGNHFFYLSSDGGSKLFISKDINAENKVMISFIDGGFPTKQYEYDRYLNQKTLPVLLKKDHYYYMEAIMKDDHENDHFEVGLQTPNGTFYKVIPSQFLWTTTRRLLAQNATAQSILIRTAARAGAKAGSSVGFRLAVKSGAKAGAEAGAIAGMKAGALAGDEAGERAAMETTVKTIQDSLNRLHGDSLHKFTIDVRNGTVVSVTGPGMGGNGVGGPGVGGNTGAGGGLGTGTGSVGVGRTGTGSASAGGTGIGRVGAVGTGGSASAGGTGTGSASAGGSGGSTSAGGTGGSTSAGGTGGSTSAGGTGGSASVGGTGGRASAGGTGGSASAGGIGGSASAGATGGSASVVGTGGSTSAGGTGGSASVGGTGGSASGGGAGRAAGAAGAAGTASVGGGGGGGGEVGGSVAGGVTAAGQTGGATGSSRVGVSGGVATGSGINGGSVSGGGGVGESGGTATGVAAGQTGAKATGSSGAGISGGTSGGVASGPGINGASPGNAGAGGSMGGGTVAGSSVGVASAAGAAGGTQITSGAGAPGAAESGGAASQGYNPLRKVTVIPKKGQDPQSLARSLTWTTGSASRIVAEALYTMHSIYIPYQQENYTLNNCWRSYDGYLAIRPYCQVFKTKVPGLYKGMEQGRDTVSFESVCLPGFYIRQKNYRFILDKRDGSNLFDKEGSFYVYAVMQYSRNFLFRSTHDDWYICHSRKRDTHGMGLTLDFYNGDPSVLERCTFLLHPMPQHDDKYKNCRNVVGPRKSPSINGQPLPHPPHLVSKVPPYVPALPTCIPVCSTGTVGGTSRKSAGVVTPTHARAPSNSVVV